ncbi:MULTISPECIES: hypothetical protein [unclassified Sinorhizobium]|uniref:hypothetical protein n=1 Tax=unclassified Sinorhizobium TaxID=2613772 RepID=UPI003524EB99
MSVLRSSVLIAVITGATTLNSIAAPVGTVRWPDTVPSRLEAFALIQSLQNDLLSNESATLTLDRWCETHHLGDPPEIIVERIPDQVKQAGDEERKILEVGIYDVVKYRRVKLRCGDRVLSEADNWYVPDRLTPEMNEKLDHSDMPFGRVVCALNFHRKTLQARLLWNPLPSDWELKGALPSDRSGSGYLDIPPYLFQHRAVLTLAGGVPFSYVVETYTNSVLDFPAPSD